MNDYDVKIPNFTFYGGRKQATTKFRLQLGVTVHEFMLISICQCLCHTMKVSWSHGFIRIDLQKRVRRHHLRGILNSPARAVCEPIDRVHSMKNISTVLEKRFHS